MWIKAYVIVSKDMKSKFIDAIKWYSVDAGCVVVVFPRVQSSDVKHNGVRWGESVSTKSRQK